MRTFGVDPPEPYELGLRFVGSDEWPLHVKDVALVDRKALSAMPTASSQSKEFWIYAEKWLDDLSRYAAVPAEPPKPTRFLQKDVELMHGIRKIVRADLLPQDFGFAAPRFSSVRSFPVYEPFKVPPRRRGIVAPTANDYLGRDTLQDMWYQSRAECRLSAIPGDEWDRIAFHFDFAAWYDQFEYLDSIARLFSFRAPDGEVYCLKRLAMGQRQACEIGQGATWVLCDFKHHELVRITTMIDNVRIVGPRSHALNAARTFLQRCKLANATLNDMPAGFDPDTASDDELLALASDQETFLGEEYVYSKSQVRVGKKSIEKLKLSIDRMANWTVTHMAAHMSLLFYCSGTLGISPAHYYDALRVFRRACERTSRGTLRWDDPSPQFNGAAREELLAWTDRCLENAWRKIIPTQSEDHTHVIVTDASGTGWGAICIDLRTGSVEFANGDWDEHMDMANSTDAEPEGIYRAFCRFVPPNAKWNILLATDHMAIPMLNGKRWSKGFAANLLFKRLYNWTATIDFTHVAGEDNMADGISRGKSLTTTQREILEWASRADGEWNAETRFHGKPGSLEPDKLHRPAFMV
jgi:hypothetical protein